MEIRWCRLVFRLAGGDEGDHLMGIQCGEKGVRVVQNTLCLECWFSGQPARGVDDDSMPSSLLEILKGLQRRDASAQDVLARLGETGSARDAPACRQRGAIYVPPDVVVKHGGSKTWRPEAELLNRSHIPTNVVVTSATLAFPPCWNSRWIYFRSYEHG